MFDKFDCLSHGSGDDVGVGPGLGGQLGLLVSLHGLESGDLTVDLRHRAEHPMAGVGYELLAHRLQPPVHVLLRVQQMLL